MSFPRYPKYKESGVEWLGEVPKHWVVKSVRHLIARLDQGTSPNAGNVPAEDEEWGVLKLSAINRGIFRPDENKALAELPVGLVPLTPMRGDVLVSRSNTPERVGDAAYVSDDFHTLLIPDLIYRLQLDPSQAHARYFCSFLLSQACRAQIEADARGSSGSMVKLSQGHLRAWSIPVPPLAEQACIAEFLDQETAKIDELVAEQQRLIELLKEKRQAVISHAVTKGLNPHAPMKPSGIEWLGEVPAHWEVRRLKHVSPQVTVGIVVEPSKYYTEKGVPALRSLNILPGVVTLENLVFISTEANDLHSKSKLSAGDLVAVRSGQPGTTAIIPEELHGCNCIDLIIIRKPTTGCGRFLCWYLASDAAVMQFSVGSGGAIQQHFNVSTAMDLVTAVPPPEEQDAIVVFLDSETTKLDALTADAQRAIDLLQERRTALISAAVTGQIDVRHLAENEMAA